MASDCKPSVAKTRHSVARNDRYFYLHVRWKSCLFFFLSDWKEKFSPFLRKLVSCLSDKLTALTSTCVCASCLCALHIQSQQQSLMLTCLKCIADFSLTSLLLSSQSPVCFSGFLSRWHIRHVKSQREVNNIPCSVSMKANIQLCQCHTSPYSASYNCTWEVHVTLIEQVV